MCSLSPDDIHGESQGLLHTVRLTLRRQTGSFPLIMGAGAHCSAQMLSLFSPHTELTGIRHWETLSQDFTVLCWTDLMFPGSTNLGQLDGFVELVQGALQVRQLLRTQHPGEKIERVGDKKKAWCAKLNSTLLCRFWTKWLHLQQFSKNKT